MRNVFDQYTQPENQLTHALMCTLHADRALLRPFLSFAGCQQIPKGELAITEQQVPGERSSGEEGESRGLPDGCVFSDTGWALLIEAKVQDKPRTEQLRRHARTAERHGFEHPGILLVSVDPAPPNLPPRSTHRTWREVYLWFTKQADRSAWARTLVEYMRAFEARMIERDYAIRGTITMYDGLRFDTNNPYTYAEAKRLIRLLGDELQQRPDLRKLGVDPKGQRRTAITGSTDSRVWDFLPLKIARDASSFTEFPHLTFGISAERAVAAITVPNGVRGGFRSRLKDLGSQGFVDLLREISEDAQHVRTASKGARLFVHTLQRHYKSQRSLPVIDARLEADLLTLHAGSDQGVKYQPQWVEMIHDVLTQKRSNIQLGLEFRFSYDCPTVRSAASTDLFADAWKAMFPIVCFATGD